MNDTCEEHLRFRKILELTEPNKLLSRDRSITLVFVVVYVKRRCIYCIKIYS